MKKMSPESLISKVTHWNSILEKSMDFSINTFTSSGAHLAYYQTIKMVGVAG
jgi:hypothetical protein